MQLCDTAKNKQILAINKISYLQLILRCLKIMLHTLFFLNLDFLLAINFKGSTIIFCKSLSLYQDCFEDVLELVSEELNNFGLIAGLFRQIRGHTG